MPRHRDNLSRLATLESPKTQAQAQAQAQAQPETEGDLALLAKSGHAWSVAKECATFRVFAESSRATWMCSDEGGWGAKEISQEPADLVELGGKTGGQMGQRFATEMSEAVTPQNWSWSLSCNSVRYTARKPKWIYIYIWMYLMHNSTDRQLESFFLLCTLASCATRLPSLVRCQVWLLVTSDSAWRTLTNHVSPSLSVSLSLCRPVRSWSKPAWSCPYRANASCPPATRAAALSSPTQSVPAATRTARSPVMRIAKRNQCPRASRPRMRIAGDVDVSATKSLPPSAAWRSASAPRIWSRSPKCWTHRMWSWRIRCVIWRQIVGSCSRCCRRMRRAVSSAVAASCPRSCCSRQHTSIWLSWSRRP